MHNNNRKLYVEEMRKDAFSAFTVCQNKEYDMFDEEMAIAMAEAFAKSNNSEKCQFPGYFDMMWKGNISSYAFKIDESFAGFRKLQYLLEEQKEKLQVANRAIAVHHTDYKYDVVVDIPADAGISAITDKIDLILDDVNNSREPFEEYRRDILELINSINEGNVDPGAKQYSFHTIRSLKYLENTRIINVV